MLINKIAKAVLPLLLTMVCFNANAQIIDSFPYFTGFEGTTGTLHENYPEGWTSEDLNTNSFNSSWEIIKNSNTSQNARTDSSAINVFSNMAEDNDDWLFTPGIQMVEGATYTLTFWYNTIDFSSSEKLKVHVGGEAVSATMGASSALWSNEQLDNTTYQEAVVVYEADSNGIFYFGFHAYSSALSYVLLIDDITIEETGNTIGIENEADGLEVEVYPNPSVKKLNVRTNNLKVRKKMVKLFDVRGELVYQGSFKGVSHEIFVNQIPHGTYYLHVFGEKGEVHDISKVQVGF